ncbi:SAM-dependent methyltransferase [Actinomadura sp. KC06]|uniref:SAM-dependent methyltransferase n=1 Tax=Actinomadura sp. KC06 TaxID=2530369 RepID=UPI0014051335|nr:SAM-dependent methyltransferase [Actinomadura sp. KC06]
MPEPRPGGGDFNTPSPARVYDYVLGGSDHYAADRQMAEGVLRDWPALATLAPSNRAWILRVVRILTEAGIDQFLDVGSGLPTAEAVHEVAQRINPDSRVVYVDNDPIVESHRRALLAENDLTAYVHAPAQNANTVLRAAEQTLDPRQPVAVLMSAVLHYVPEPPAEVVAPYVRWLAPGSYLAISHVAIEGSDPQMLSRIARVFPQQTVRHRAEIEAAFAGLELLEPGLVDVERWRPDTEVSLTPQRLLAGVGKVT